MAWRYGTSIRDVIYGTSNNDWIFGRGGNDYLVGHGGDDRIYGEDGNDFIYGGSGNDYIRGGNDDDWLFGQSGDDVILGESGNDWLWGHSGNDTLNGGAGNDMLDGGAGADQIEGSTGIDTVSYAYSSGGVYVDLWSGRGYWNDAQGDRISGVENVNGSRYQDYLRGDYHDNVLSGADGNDYLYGFSGDDTLLGGNGNDYLNGGSGADFIDGGAGIDWVDYRSSNGAVTVNLENGFGIRNDASGDTIINVENIWGSAYDDGLIGDGGDNVIRGYHGNDRLDGRDGNDMLYGDQGDDLFLGSSGADYMDGGLGHDTAYYLYDGGTQAVHVDLLAGRGYSGNASGDTYRSIEHVVGSHHSGNQLYGDHGANSLDSYGRNDVVDGRGGDDIIRAAGWSFDGLFIGGAGDDEFHLDGYGHEVVGGSGVDTIHNGIALSATDPFEVDFQDGEIRIDGSLVYEFSGVENYDAGRSGRFTDHIVLGDSADNVITTGAGDDILNGRRGNDVLTGGEGADIFQFRHYDYGESDFVLDFEVGVDRIDLSNTEVSNFADLFESGDGDYMVQGGSDIMIYSSDEDTIVLYNVQIADLTEADFIF